MSYDDELLASQRFGLSFSIVTRWYYQCRTKFIFAQLILPFVPNYEILPHRGRASSTILTFNKSISSCFEDIIHLDDREIIEYLRRKICQRQ